MPDRIVIVGCGRRKQAGTHPAAELYTGSLFAARWRAAQVIAPGRCWIISAKHGLLHPEQEVAWYDLKLGQPGSVNAVYVARQAVKAGLIDAPVTVLASAAYASLIMRAWPDGSAIDTPLAHLGMGEQMVRCYQLAAGDAAPGGSAGPPVPGAGRFPHRSA